MPTFRHLELLGRGPVSAVRLLYRGPFHGHKVEELVAEWNSVADGEDCKTLFVDCSNVRIPNSELLGRLISLQRRLKQKQGTLVLCGLCAEVGDVLSSTRLDRYFEIRETVVQEAV
jgi:anti-anti-sigma factor